MRKSGVLAIITMLVGILFAFTSCDQTTSTEFQESFQKVKEVTPLPSAQNVTMDLSKESQDSFFSVSLNGKNLEGWCIEWNEASVQGTQPGTKMFSTKGQEAWKELNYFMSIKDNLRAQDPELTYKEIQVVIWSLIDNPSFDVDKISEYENIDSRIYNDGQTLFNVQKVKDIVAQVNSYFTSAKSKSDYEFPGTTLIENNGQTIMVGNETAFAVKTKVVNGETVVDSDYSTCFSQEILQDVTFPNWGWTNGPISVPQSGEIDLTFDIYAGAGKCDLNKGTKVGELDLNLTSAGTLSVLYRMTETSGFTGATYTLLETHFYAGNDPYPTNDESNKFTVAPGQYGNENYHDDVTEFPYTIEGLSGDIYFIAHAVVSGFDPDASDE